MDYFYYTVRVRNNFWISGFEDKGIYPDSKSAIKAAKKLERKFDHVKVERSDARNLKDRSPQFINDPRFNKNKSAKAKPTRPFQPRKPKRPIPVTGVHPLDQTDYTDD